MRAVLPVICFGLASVAPVHALELAPKGRAVASLISSAAVTHSVAVQTSRREVTRKVAKLEIDGANVEFSHGVPKITDREYLEFESLEAGEVVRFFKAPAIRLRTDLDLVIGTMEAKAGNAAPNFPGLYALWLKKSSAGWQLVFNSEADSWGSQHDPAADVGATELRHETSSQSVDQFELEVVETGSGSGATHQLQIRWGSERWSAEVATGSR